MRIAVPVYDESLKIFGNTGHTPFLLSLSKKAQECSKKLIY